MSQNAQKSLGPRAEDAAKTEGPPKEATEPSPEDSKPHTANMDLDEAKKEDLDEDRKKLLTSSPEAIRVAAQITPNRLANLLIRKGPLAIRLITAHLAAEVPGFELLSLSKQRRLIMAAMEHGDSQNNVVFEKIGWGQWAVRYINSDYIVTEPNAADKPRLNIHELREKAKLGWLKKEPVAGDLASDLADLHRRDSISSTHRNLHNVTVPSGVHESAISDSEPDSDDDAHNLLRPNLGTNDESMDDDDLFAFDDDLSKERRFKRSPPIKFANRVPSTKFSPPPLISGNRRKSLLSVSKIASYTRHPQILNRSRLNSMENLDEYMFSSARNLPFLVASPPLLHVASVPTTSPLGSWNGYLQEGLGARDFTISSENVAGRRKLSFNESSMRSTLSSSLPRGRPAEHVMYTADKKEPASDTDEEDWASMGPELLRSGAEQSDVQNDESTAARALVNLMST